MIKVGDIIKHKAFLDVAVQALVITQSPEGDLDIGGVWINQGCTNSYYINIPINFILKKEHIRDWYKCLNPTSKFIRNETWEQLQ